MSECHTFTIKNNDMKVENNFLFEDDGKQVEYRPSPNVGKDKKGYKVIVIHFDASSGLQGLNWLLNKNSKVSSELWLSREGKVIQLAPLNTTCWHAGVSTWRGLEGLNSYGIGIEIQNTGSQEYTDVQMDKLGEVVKPIVEKYGLEIVGHEDISPLRKNDPSGAKVNLFDWKRLFDAVGVKTTLYKTSSDLNVRRGQGIDYPVVTTLKKGVEVYELNRIGDWSKIQVKGSKQSGWTSNKYLVK